jgi:hypothetical protein
MASNNRFLLGRRSRELALLRIRASAISRLLAMAALRAAVERVGIHGRPSPIHKGSPRVVITTRPIRLIPVSPPDLDRVIQ